jgi:hypothetical protein
MWVEIQQFWQHDREPWLFRGRRDTTPFKSIIQGRESYCERSHFGNQEFFFAGSELSNHPSPHPLFREPQVVVDEDRDRFPGLCVLPPSEAIRIEAGGQGETGKSLAEWMEVSRFPYFDWDRLFV